MIRLDDVIQELTKHHPDADVSLVRKAYVYSAKAHRVGCGPTGNPI